LKEKGGGVMKRDRDDYEDFLLSCLEEKTKDTLVLDGTIRFRLFCLLEQFKDNPEVHRLLQNMQKDKDDAYIFTKDDAIFMFNIASESISEVRSKHKIQVLELEAAAEKRALEQKLEIHRLKTELESKQPVEKILRDNMLFQEDLMALAREKDALQKQFNSQEKDIQVISAHIRSAYDKRRCEAQERLNVMHERFVKEFDFENLDKYDLRIMWREHLELTRLCLETYL
jgi:hypothetical protein